MLRVTGTQTMRITRIFTDFCAKCFAIFVSAFCLDKNYIVVICFDKN